MESEDEEGNIKRLECHSCGHIGLQESAGYYYCQNCDALADVQATGVADEDYVDKGDGGPLYIRSNTRHSTRPSQGATVDQSLLLWRQEENEAINNDNTNYKNIKREVEYYGDNYYDGMGPTEPEDFGPSAAGKLGYQDYYMEVRLRYVMGMQWMIELQCEALVRDFHVTPLICGVASTVWLRFLAGTGVFKDDWADRILMESSSEIVEESRPHSRCTDQSHDSNSHSEPRVGSTNEPHDDVLLNEPRHRYPNEPYNSSGQRAVMIWFRYLRKTIPLSSSLAILFLACHVAREAVLPTDIVRWSIEGKLPYFAAHAEIGKRFERPSPACPISSSLMFRPSQAVPSPKLESMAANIAESMDLQLPPVNFYEIASRYLKQLSLPVEKILPHACRIYEWSMPPDLWLSANEYRLPTRVCVLSILIVAIRILYNIHGFGAWESSLSTHVGRLDPPRSSETRFDSKKISCSSPIKLDDSSEKSAGNIYNVQNSGLDSRKLLHNLERKYDDFTDTYDFAKDLPSYLQYCKDVVFAGAGPSHMDREEVELIEKFWDFYQNEKYSEPAESPGSKNNDVSDEKRLRKDDAFVQYQPERKKIKGNFYASINADASTYATEEIFEGLSADTNTQWADIGSQLELDSGQPSYNLLRERNSEDNKEASPEIHKDEALRRLKLDMEENRFCYIPPRVNIKRFDYLHYVRKKDVGAFTYVAHADYYILLRACAKVAEVDVRIMHIGVLRFERRLAWLEKKIDHCLHLTPPNITCEFCSDMPDHPDDDLVGLSQLNL